MTHEDFSNFMNTFGANISRWPENVQAAAQEFILANPEYSRSALKEEAAFDAALENARLSPGTDMLKARILNTAEDHSAGQGASFAPTPIRKGFGYRAVAAMVLLSFALGFIGADLTAPVDDEFTSAEYLAANNDWQALAEETDMTEIYEWVETDTAL